MPAVDWGRVAAGLFAGGVLAVLAVLLAVELAEPATPSSARTVTAVFGGAPAAGPWQRIGSVAEVTAAGAATSADDDLVASWRAHDLPDALWDALVTEVAADLVGAAPPAADDADDLQAATGGVQWSDADSGGRGIVATFDAVVADDDGLRRRRWAYLVDPAGHVVVAGPERLSVPHRSAAVAALDARTWRWVREQPPRGGG